MGDGEVTAVVESPARGTVVDRLRDLADELDQAAATANAGSALVAIPGNDLKVGHVWWPITNRRMQVERMTLKTVVGRPQEPMLIAHGRCEFKDKDGFVAEAWTENCFGDDWVVVER